MRACHAIAENTLQKQCIGKTCQQRIPVCELAEKIILVAAQRSLDLGGGYGSTGAFQVMEDLFCSVTMPECRRSEVGSIDKGRLACCMVLSRKIPRYGPASHIVHFRSSELQALTKHVNSIICDTYPSFRSTSLQLTINGRAIMHTDRHNEGISVAVACDRYVGGQLFTIGHDSKPVLLECGGKPQLFDGRLPHCNMPFAGYRLSAIAFVHSRARGLHPDERAKLEMLGFRPPPPLFTTVAAPIVDTVATDSYTDLCHSVIEDIGELAAKVAIPSVRRCTGPRAGWKGIIAFLTGATLLSLSSIGGTHLSYSDQSGVTVVKAIGRGSTF